MSLPAFSASARFRADRTKERFSEIATYAVAPQQFQSSSSTMSIPRASATLRADMP